MPHLIDPETGERVFASEEAAKTLKKEHGYTDAESEAPLGPPAGVPQPSGVIVQALRDVDWDGADLAKVNAFLESGNGEYVEAVLAHEQSHRQRPDVIEAIEQRLAELADDGTLELALERPAKSANRDDWDAYARSLDIDPDEYSSKDDLIAAVDRAEDA